MHIYFFSNLSEAVRLSPLKLHPNPPQHLASTHGLSKPSCSNELLIPVPHGASQLNCGQVRGLHPLHAAPGVQASLVLQLLQGQTSTGDDLLDL